MDKTAKIIVFLCASLLCVNFYYNNKNLQIEQAQKAKELSLKKAAEAAQAAQASEQTITQAIEKKDILASTTLTVDSQEMTHTLTNGSTTFTFTTKGGGIKSAKLAGSDNTLLNQFGKDPIGALRRDPSTPEVLNYKIIQKSPSSITFESINADNIIIRKHYTTLTQNKVQDEHLLQLDLTLINQSTLPLKTEELFLYTGAAHSVLPNQPRTAFFWNDNGAASTKDHLSFKGGWFSNALSEQSISSDSMRFAGVMNRFYIHLFNSTTPGKAKPAKLWTNSFTQEIPLKKADGTTEKLQDTIVQASLSLPPLLLQPQQQLVENYEIYLGPREYERLHNLERDRDYTMFYGIFSPVSRFMVGVMRWMHDNVYANWGVAIILLTLLIRIIVWPLMLKSYTSMKKMGLLAPEIKKVQEKFKDDPTKQQAEMMKVYGQYGLSPFSFMGGCLPMLLQLPIFIGLYGVLDIAAELRGQSFLWVSDLSGPDIIYALPFYGLTINPLPLVMMVSNFLQMKLTPQPPTVDKTQQNIFMMMPFIFLFVCYNFAAALALYWTTQNLFSIFQTFVQNKLMKPVTLTKLSSDQLKNKGESPFAKMIQEQSRRSQGK